MVFEQTDNIQDYIFPIIKSKKDFEVEGYRYEELIGTGFFIGSNGYALTAGHVIDQLIADFNTDTDAITIALQKYPNWFGFEIENYEKHPTEDVAILKIKSRQKWKSILQVTNEPQYSAIEYFCFGYPHEVAKELHYFDNDALDRPELIYTQGYVRRRISRNLYPTMIFNGNQFYEISEIVGGGNSGAPLNLKRLTVNGRYRVFGIYIGENEKVGYAVRAEAFCDWEPKILGKSILDESKA